MRSKQLIEQIDKLSFILFTKTDKDPEVYLIGSGTVKEIVHQNGVIYLLGENYPDDPFMRGYATAVDDMKRSIQEEFNKVIEDMRFTSEESYNFERDYHGQFKKKDKEV